MGGQGKGIYRSEQEINATKDKVAHISESPPNIQDLPGHLLKPDSHFRGKEWPTLFKRSQNIKLFISIHREVITGENCERLSRSLAWASFRARQLFPKGPKIKRYSHKFI